MLTLTETSALLEKVAEQFDALRIENQQLRRQLELLQRKAEYEKAASELVPREEVPQKVEEWLEQNIDPKAAQEAVKLAASPRYSVGRVTSPEEPASRGRQTFEAGLLEGEGF